MTTTDRETEIRCARAYLTEASAVVVPGRVESGQGELFA